jgi:hypothetical protein
MRTQFRHYRKAALDIFASCCESDGHNRSIE